MPHQTKSLSTKGCPIANKFTSKKDYAIQYNYMKLCQIASGVISLVSEPNFFLLIASDHVKGEEGIVTTASGNSQPHLFGGLLIDQGPAHPHI